MYDRESLYLQLPIPLQNLACSIEGWRIQKNRLGTMFCEFLRDAEGRSFMTVDQAKNYRDKRVQAFVHHCYHTVPFYHRRFRDVGIQPLEIQGLDDLHKLPILTKEEVQENSTSLVSNAVQDKQRIMIHTSGTTGGGLRFATTLNAIQEQWAVWWRYRRWHGLQQGTWCGYFGGRSVVPLSQDCPPFWRYNVPGKQIFFSGYHMSPKNLDYYVQELRRKKPPWLHGYPSLLALIAGHILEKRLDLGYQVQWITVGAENLLPQQVALMHEAFGVRPRQHYGMAEAIANISECEHGSLHVDEDFAAVEFIQHTDIAGYKIIGTNFSNPATPLLRYDVQDNVSIDEGTCSCGRSGRIVSSIDGREEDYIILRSGVRLGRMDHIFKDMVNIREAQIIQKYPGEIKVRIVRGSAYAGCDEAALLDEVYKRVGKDTKVEIEYVETLERSITGKLRFVVSELMQGKLQL